MPPGKRKSNIKSNSDNVKKKMAEQSRVNRLNNKRKMLRKHKC
jgi:hypothetical protein